MRGTLVRKWAGHGQKGEWLDGNCDVNPLDQPEMDLVHVAGVTPVVVWLLRSPVEDDNRPEGQSIWSAPQREPSTMSRLHDTGSGMSRQLVPTAKLSLVHESSVHATSSGSALLQKRK